MSLLSSEIWISLVSLTAMEIVLGIDNILVISILSAKLPPKQRPKVRNLGLGLALLLRLLLLLTLSWLMGLTAELFRIGTRGFSLRSLVLLAGGLFLIAKASHEVYDKVEGGAGPQSPTARSSFFSVLLQILAMDLVFSLDSVITAIGMAQQIGVMITAMVLAMMVMVLAATAVSDLVHRHPSLTILGLSFLLLVGVLLVAEGLGTHVDRGYVYFAMAFSLVVEVLNLRLRRRHQPVELHGPGEERGSP